MVVRFLIEKCRFKLYVIKYSLNFLFESFLIKKCSGIEKNYYLLVRKVACIIYICKPGISNLYYKCQDFIKWPSREAVDSTMPEVFKPEFEKCRVIIDCTEFRTEIPPGIANRINMYSYFRKVLELNCLWDVRLIV